MGAQDILSLGLFSSTGTFSCMLHFPPFTSKCFLMTQLGIKQHWISADVWTPLLYIIYPCRKVFEQWFSLFLGYLKMFFPQECSFSLRPLRRWPFGTKVCVGTHGQSLSWHAGEVSGGRFQTRSLLLHTCCPAGAALAGHSTAPRCRRGHPMHKGPLRTIYKTPDNFYLPLPIHSAPQRLLSLTNPSKI